MICIDTHLHFYDSYDTGSFLKSLVTNLEGICPGCDKAGIVLDRAGGGSFASLVAKARELNDVEVSAEDGVLSFNTDESKAKIYQGVQIACRERFEVLGLFCGVETEDGIPASEAIQLIAASGGLPVLAWAPGKWMFGRRRLVEEVLKDTGVNYVFLGDTALRPNVWGEPQIMRAFRMKGGKVLCGSDPLPFAGQESAAGTYSTKVNADVGADAADHLRRLLESDQVGLGNAGSRVGTFAFAYRMLRHKLGRG